MPDLQPYCGGYGCRLIITAIFAALVGCAQGSGSGGDGGFVDSGPRADADPNAPDADPNAPDAANGCPTAPCDLLAQCGCTGGEVCDLDNTMLPTGGTACREVVSPGTEQGNCNTSNQCAGGYVCLGSPGQCRRYCGNDGDCGAGAFCNLDVVYDSGGGNFMDVPGATTCSKSCEPDKASANGCPGSPQFGCHIYQHDPDDPPVTDGDEVLISDCSAPGLGGDDADCSVNGSFDCQPGFDCVVLTFTTICTVNGDCAAGQECDQAQGQCIDDLCKQNCRVLGGTCAVGTCNSFNPAAIVDGVEYGVCF
jgi:hypothetical protein